MSLLAPVFLAGLLAVVLPWWLHRLSRDNPPLQDFGSSMFLQAGETTSSKQRQLRYKKLFSLRFLLLALLALLFAEPALQLSKLIGSSDYRQIMVVDTSLSQRLGDRWPQTLELVNKQLDGASVADEIFLISANHQFQQSEGDNSVAAAREQLTQLKPGLTRLDYGQLSPAIASLVEQSNLPVVVHLFTDTQTTALPARFSDLTLDGVERFDIHSTATDSDANLSITGQLNHSADGISDLSVIVGNHSDAKAEATVQLIAADTTLDAVNLAIDGNSSTVHRFAKVDTSAARGAIELRLTAGDSQADQLADDNTWLIALPDRARTEVTLLQSNALANRYAAAAIESDPRYTTRALEGENLSASSAGGMLIIADASALSDRSTTKLRQYLSDGGNALIVVGADPHAVQMRSLLNVRSASTRQFEADNSGSAANQSTDPALRPQSIGRVDDTHPMTSDTSSNWRSISVLRHLPLTANESDRVIIELTDGSPLLIERSIGDGRVLVLASALKSSWNGLAVNPLFVAFIVGAIEHLSGFDNASLERSVGETITVPPGAQLLNPDGEPVRDLSDIKRKGRVELRERGIYTIRSTTGTEVISINVDSRESDTRATDAQTISQWQATGVRSTTQNSPENSSNNPANNDAGSNTASILAEDKRQTKSLWPWLLAILLVLALTETLYSHRHLQIKREA